MDFLACALLFAFLGPGEASRVLAVYHPIAKSHSMFLERTARDLEAAGHNLTFLHTPLTHTARDHPSKLNGPLSVFPLVASESEDRLQGILDKLLWAKSLSFLDTYKTLFSLAFIFSLQCRLTAHPELQALMDGAEFDMILSDPTFSPCLLRLSANTNAPSLETVGISYLVTQSFAHGSSFPFSYATGNILPYGRGVLTFPQRVLNAVDLTSNIALEYVFFSFAAAVDTPTNTDFFYTRVRNISAYFVNDHEFLQPPRPRIPSMHLIGGPEPGPITQELGEELSSFMGGRHSGVIVMSLSTMSKSVHMPQEFMDAFLCVFRLRSYRILWRYEGSVPAVAGLRHVKVLSWMPLKAVLQDPRTIAMVTHGGINSVMEAMHFGVPLLGIPLYGDQASVLARIRDWGGALTLPKDRLNKASFDATLAELLGNPKYALGMDRCRRLVRDRLMSPREEGVFWSQYVLRHRGVDQRYAIKSNRLHLWEYFSLDMFLPLAAISLLILVPSIVV